MNYWFIGTGQFAALCLEGLTKKNLTFKKIITGLPTRSGRNGKENPSPVELKANELGFNVTRTGKLTENHEILSEFENEKPDLIFVIDFGQIIREPFLSGTKFGCLNIHPSLLPKYRGAAPIQRALMNGEKFTGVTVFKLVKEMDAGGILAQEKFEIPENFYASDLYSKLSETGCEIAVEALKNLPDLVFTPQDNSQATYAEKIQKNEFEISFSMTAEKFCDTVRALDMSGGAYAIIKGKRVKIWRAETVQQNFCENNIGTVKFEDNPIIICKNFSVKLCEVQSEGKKRMSAREWAAGLRLKDGENLLQ